MSEAIQSRVRRTMDCFVANAPRNDGGKSSGEGFRTRARSVGRIVIRDCVGRGSRAFDASTECSIMTVLRSFFRGLAGSLAALLFVAIAATLAIGQEREAIWVSATEPNLGANVVRDDGRVVCYRDVTGLKGPRVASGLENIVATTARLALRRDGVVPMWEPRCDRNPDNSECVEHEFHEFPPAHPMAGLISRRHKRYLSIL